MATDIQQKLDAKREGYECERSWQRLLLDAYLGSGGFQGRLKQPDAGFWGEAASAYSSASTFSMAGWQNAGIDADENCSYLDRYPREDSKKFRRRVHVAHYLNYVKPITNLKISYVVRKPHNRNNVPPAIQKWIDRTGYDAQFRRFALMTAVIGYFLPLVDKPKVDPNARTAAEVGNVDPYIVPMMPCHAVDWRVGADGKFDWIKFRTEDCVRETWDSESVEVKRYTIWTRTHTEVWESTGDGDPVKVSDVAHNFGCVPCVPWRTDASIESDVKADSINAEIVPEVRRLFNLLSELDEILRGSTFPLLLVPRDEGSEGGGESKPVGTENGITVGPDQKNLPTYIAPPASVAATYESRIEKTIIEIYRMARVEYDRASGVNSSAQSKQQNFEQTNLSIVDFAKALAAADRETLIVVGRMLGGISEEALQKIECVAHQSYASDDLNEEIAQVMDLITMSIGDTARSEVLKRLVFRVVQNLNAEKRKTIESEIDAEVKKDAQESALAGMHSDAVQGSSADTNNSNDGSPSSNAQPANAGSAA